jgi:2-oxoglutarate ferredoxin oxidoreductase subunit gamma
MVNTVPDLQDVQIVRVPAYEAAESLGNQKAANMIMLGAYLEVTGAIEQESILSAFVEHGIKPELLKGNRDAIEAGRRLVAGTKFTGKSA